MVAKLAKNPNRDRRRGPAVEIIPHGVPTLHPLTDAEAPAVALAPSDASPIAAVDAAPRNELDRLYLALAAVSEKANPRTARLLASGTRKVAQKVIEEAGEVALAAVKHNDSEIVRESADLLYHLAVLWHRAGIGADAIWAEMRRRADALGIAEKLPKPAARTSRKSGCRLSDQDMRN
jgi:phosphoribosyl-ATP pyrophosphohydrolase